MAILDGDRASPSEDDDDDNDDDDNDDDAERLALFRANGTMILDRSIERVCVLFVHPTFVSIFKPLKDKNRPISVLSQLM